MQRYFVNESQLNKDHINIIGGDVHHIKNVMRMKEGDNVICATGNKAYLCEIESILDSVSCKIVKELSKDSETNGIVTIAHGLVRREKTEEVVRRLTELGCCEYIPLIMKRSIIKIEKVNDFKKDRYEKIIKEASEQSQRNKLMKIHDVCKFNDLLTIAKEYDLCLLADANEEDFKLKDLEFDYKGKKVLIVIGPEGGFDDSEKDILIKNNFKVVSFGNRVMRTETAPLFAMSIIGYLMGDKDEN